MVQCADKSDELNCSYLSVGHDYSKQLMPSKPHSEDPVVVFINVSIVALPYIDTAQLKFTADYYLNLRWYDLRVDLKDLNRISLLNVLSEDDVSKIWKPQLTFTNALGPFQTEYDGQTTATVIRESEPLQEDLELATEGEHGGGITRRQYYFATH